MAVWVRCAVKMKFQFECAATSQFFVFIKYTYFAKYLHFLRITMVRLISREYSYGHGFHSCA